MYKIIDMQERFKDGDILHSKNSNTMVIFKCYDTNTNLFCIYYNNQGINNSDFFITSSFRHATDVEKQRFFKELASKKLRWNTETKEIEKIRKRVKKYEKYLYIRCGLVVETEDCTAIDDINYMTGNYYLLSEREQAERDAAVIRVIFDKRLKYETLQD